MEKEKKVKSDLVTTLFVSNQEGRTYNIVYPSRNEDNMFMTDQLGEWAAAMANYQQEFQGVSKDSVMQISTAKKAYTTLDEILNVVRPITSKYGIVISQFVNGHSITTLLIHSSGQYIGNTVNYAEYITLDTAAKLAKAQTAGIVITYFKRYSLAAALGISVDEDSDGEDMARKLGTGATQGDNPIEKALKSTFVAMKKDADGKLSKDNKWFDPAKTAFVHEGTSYLMGECATPEKLIGWLGKIAQQGLCANATNKDAIRAKYEELVKAASAQ